MTFAQNITQLFRGDWHGDYGTFPTPGHGPKDRGMSVKDDPAAPDGVLIHSFNGGDPLAIKDQCRDLGILPPRSPEPSRQNPSAWRVTGTYEYTDADGAVLYRTKRQERPGERKKFVAEHLRGKDWVFGIKGIPRVLYRLPDILSTDPARPVYLVEGERKADKLAAWGLVATAVAFGANGWQRGYASALAGRTVIILPDNDDVGREFAAKAGRDIEAAGGSVRIVNLPRLPPKGDIMDWSGTADDLRALTNAADSPPSNLLQSLDLATLAGIKPQAKHFAIERLAPLAEVTLFTGPGSAGKSLLGQQLATAAAAGLSCLGLAVMAGPAIYLTCEDDADQLHWRQAHICDALGVSMANLAGRLHLISLRGELDNALTIEAVERGKPVPSPSYARLVRTIDASGAKLVMAANGSPLPIGSSCERLSIAPWRAAGGYNERDRTTACRAGGSR